MCLNREGVARGAVPVFVCVPPGKPFERQFSIVRKPAVAMGAGGGSAVILGRKPPVAVTGPAPTLFLPAGYGTVGLPVRPPPTVDTPAKKDKTKKKRKSEDAEPSHKKKSRA